MRSTIDKSGRLVVPKVLRDRIGLRAGVIDLTVDGTGIRIESVPGEGLVEEGERLVIPGSGAEVDDEFVRVLRNADRR